MLILAPILVAFTLLVILFYIVGLRQIESLPIRFGLLLLCLITVASFLTAMFLRSLS
jgi:hypothetical protein